MTHKIFEGSRDRLCDRDSTSVEGRFGLDGHHPRLSDMSPTIAACGSGSLSGECEVARHDGAEGRPPTSDGQAQATALPADSLLRGGGVYCVRGGDLLRLCSLGGI